MDEKLRWNEITFVEWNLLEIFFSTCFHLKARCFQAFIVAMNLLPEKVFEGNHLHAYPSFNVIFKGVSVSIHGLIVTSCSLALDTRLFRETVCHPCLTTQKILYYRIEFQMCTWKYSFFIQFDLYSLSSLDMRDTRNSGSSWPAGQKE